MQNQSAAQHYTLWTVFVNIILASNQPLCPFASITIKGFASCFAASVMQNLDRFGETKLNKAIFFWLFSMFSSVSTGGYGTELTAAEKQIVPYQVCLEIDRNGAVGPLVHYD